MLKMFMIFLTGLFTNYFYEPNDYVIVNDTVTLDKEIIDDQNGYILTNEKNYSLTNEEKEVKIDFEGIVMKYYVSSKIYVLNKINNNVYLKIYDLDGKLENERIIFVYDNNISDINTIEFNTFIETREKVYLVGTKINFDFLTNKNQEDIFLYDITSDKYNYIGGNKDERLLGAFTIQNKISLNYRNEIYLYIKKDKKSEEPFGNGSENVLCIIKENEGIFEIEKKVYLEYNSNSESDDEYEEYYDFCYKNDLIYIITDKKIRLFDLDLKYIYFNDVPSYNQLFVGRNGFIIVFCEEYEYLLDAITLDKICEISNVYKSNSYTIKKLYNRFYAFKEIIEGKKKKYESVYFDVINIRNVNIHKEFYNDYEDDESVYSFFGKCPKLERYYDRYFDKGVFGLYNFDIEYLTPGNSYFKLGYSYNIPPRVNLTENMVYKSGYHLLFNGDGKLDGEYIYNNAQVFGEGLHEFILEGSDMTYKVSFYIANQQIDFSEKNKKEGIEVNYNKPYTIDIKINNYENYQIKDIVLEGGEIESYKFENGILSIVIKSPNIDDERLFLNDFINIYLHKIIFLINNIEYEYNVGKVFVINFIEEKPNIEKDNIDFLYTYSLNDSDKTIRSLEVELINENGNYCYYFPLSNNSISIDNIKPGNYKVNYNLCYDNNNYHYQKERLLTCDLLIDKPYFGKLETVNNNEEINRISLDLSEINEDNIYRIKVDDKLLYEKSETNTKKLVMISVCSFLSCLLLGIIINKIFNRVKRKKELF